MRKLVEDSTIEFQDVDYQEALLYIRLNQDKTERANELRSWFPQRVEKVGQDPGMNDKKRGPHK